MSFINNQSITQIEETVKKETIQKYQSYIDKFYRIDCKLNIEFNKQVCDCSKNHIYIVKFFLFPLNISKKEAIKNSKIKIFSGKFLKIKKKEKKYCIKKYKDVLLPLYLNVMFLRLYLVGKEKFFNEGFLDLFIKVFFQNRIGKYSDNFRGHDISIITIILFAVFMLIAALISAYFDIQISKNLGWW
ncbi:MAG: hypothetical protein IKU66_06595 [Clostridia bacterium]|nr:hypothetical protein [Clostridia bacterium]